MMPRAAGGTTSAAARWAQMIRMALAAGVLLVAAGCKAPTLAPAPEPVAEASSFAPAPALAPPSPVAAATAPAVPSKSRDPAVVLGAWASAVEACDWAAVRGYWGDHGTASGLSQEAFSAKWSALQKPKVTAGKGESEGAAGSIYYTAPVTITDGARIISGDVVFRRVNDVEGASPEQLRWHIESSTLAP